MALVDILVTLAKHRVRFIAVGGIAAVLRGAPIADQHTRHWRGARGGAAFC